MRQVTAIWFELTTLCNRRCPQCCLGMHKRAYVAHPWEYLEHLAGIVRGTVPWLHLTGGEPTAHPQFSEFVPKLKSLFGVDRLTVWTNGYRAKENAAVLHHFDNIWATKYGQDNAAEIDWLVKNFGATYGEPVHLNLDDRGSGEPCERGLTDPGAAYANGRFYPCCNGPAIPGAQSIEPTRDWVSRVVDVPLPCSDCCFSPHNV
jgi:hypothetical protein